MNPRLPKLPFILGDLALLATAFLLGKYGPTPLSTGMVVAIACCVAVGAALGLIPFLTDYVADSDEAAREHSAQVNAQIQRLHAAGESLTRAAAQIKSVEEAVHKSAHAAETLPYRMQEKLAEFNESLAEKEAEDREALEAELNELRAANSDQLKAVADKIHKAGADWAALEVATRKQLTAANDTAAGLEKKLKETLAQLDAKIAELHRAAGSLKHTASAAVSAPVRLATPAPAPAMVAEEPKPEPADVAPAASVDAPVGEAAAPEISEPKPKKPRAPRRPKVEEPAAATETPAAVTAPAEIIASPASEPEPSADGDDSAGEGSAKQEASASSDGATRLLATAYIGIGNKLFIRGDGPGLSWDKGVPMQFVSIGKWGWATHDATAPMRVKLYKNDETACLTGEVHLAPGRHVEATALF